MPLSSILQQIQRKGRIPVREEKKNESPSVDGRISRSSYSPSAPNLERRSSPGENKPREVDPVVARLKAARKAERERKEQEQREKKGLPPKKSKATTTNEERKYRAKTKAAASVSPRPPSREAPIRMVRTGEPRNGKKMNFNELMQKASQIDQNKLSISFRAKSKSPTADRAESATKNNGPKRASTPRQISRNLEPVMEKSRIAHSKQRKDSSSLKPAYQRPASEKREPQTVIPIRKPSSKLEARLKTLKRDTRKAHTHSDDYQSEDLDDFVVDDEDDFEATNGADTYDKDEIWALFNRGKKRSYFDRYDDYDSDDMEATGAEILDEEQKSRFRGELEDRKELEEEKRLAALKKERLKRSRSRS